MLWQIFEKLWNNKMFHIFLHFPFRSIVFSLGTGFLPPGSGSRRFPILQWRLGGLAGTYIPTKCQVVLRQVLQEVCQIHRLFRYLYFLTNKERESNQEESAYQLELDLLLCKDLDQYFRGEGGYLCKSPPSPHSTLKKKSLNRKMMKKTANIIRRILPV